MIRYGCVVWLRSNSYEPVFGVFDSIYEALEFLKQYLGDLNDAHIFRLASVVIIGEFCKEIMDRHEICKAYNKYTECTLDKCLRLVEDEEAYRKCNEECWDKYMGELI